MKKLITLTLITIIMLSLTGCGNNSDNQTKDNQSDTDKPIVVTDLGFETVNDVQDFVDNFNKKSDGYAYMVKSDAETLEGVSFSEKGYLVYRILFWSDKNVESKKDSLGDYKGESADNNLNVRLIFNPEGQLVLLKTIFTVSNEKYSTKTNYSISCDAMMEIISTLFPKNTEEENQRIYETLRLPKVEDINSFEIKDNYESNIDLLQDFFNNSGYNIDLANEDLLGSITDYEFGNATYRLISDPYGSYKNDLYIITWNIAFTTPDDFETYEAAIPMAS